MAKYVIRKCPKCKFTFEWMSLDWVAYGDPRIKCPKCGQIVIFKNIKEWKLRKPLNKIWIIFNHYTFNNLVIVAGILFVLFLLLCLIPTIWGSSYYNLFANKNGTRIWFIIGVCLFIPVSIFGHKSFMKDIKESNDRMKDKDYAQTMTLISQKYQ